MIILKGDARKLLLELIENKESNLANILANKFKDLDTNQDTRLRATIKHLIDNGYLNIPQNGWADNVPYFASLTYEGENYLEFEEQKKQESTFSKGNIYNIKTINAQGGNLILGNTENVIQTINNSVKDIEAQIKEKGGDEKDELSKLLEETKNIVTTIIEHNTMPSKKGLFNNVSNHLEKHGWFYGAIVQLIGTAAITLL